MRTEEGPFRITMIFSKRPYLLDRGESNSPCQQHAARGSVNNGLCSGIVDAFNGPEPSSPTCSITLQELHRSSLGT